MKIKQFELKYASAQDEVKVAVDAKLKSKENVMQYKV